MSENGHKWSAELFRWLLRERSHLYFTFFFAIWTFLSPNIKVSLEAKIENKRSPWILKKHKQKAKALNFFD